MAMTGGFGFVSTLTLNRLSQIKPSHVLGFLLSLNFTPSYLMNALVARTVNRAYPISVITGKPNTMGLGFSCQLSEQSGKDYLLIAQVKEEIIRVDCRFRCEHESFVKREEAWVAHRFDTV